MVNIKTSQPAGRQGFSLIELLVVIALIGILTAIATASYTTMQKKSRDSRRVSDMKAIQQGLEQSFSDNATYPTGAGCLVSATYLPNGYPTDPKTKASYNSTMTCPDGTSYCVCATLEVESGNSAVNCQGVAGDYFCVNQQQ